MGRERVCYCLIMVLFLMKGCSDEKETTRLTMASATRDAPTNEDLEQCATLMGMIFPPTARALNMKRETGGPDDALYLKLEVPRQDLENLIGNSPFAGERLRTDRRYVHDSEQDWWTPEAPTQFQSGQVMLPTGAVLNTLIDLDSDKTVTVYLMWHET